MNEEYSLKSNKEVSKEESLKDLEMRELYNRVLHDLLPDALSFPNLAFSYSLFVKALRERLHPLGKKDIQIIETKSGFKFQVDLGDRLGCDFYYGYNQELFDSLLFLNLIDNGSTVIDVGANFGYYTVMSASKVAPTGRVYAFEPHKEAYELLNNNVKMNGFEKIVSCYNLCLGDKDGESDFYVSEESSFSSMGQTERSNIIEKIKVPMRGLDSLSKELDFSKLDAIKIDVEGYEFIVLRGALETVKRSQNLAIMMEVSAKNLNEQRRQELINVLTDLYKLGFHGWIIDSTSNGLHLIKHPEDVANLGSANLFLAISESEREKQLHHAYKKMRVQASQSIAKDIGLPEGILSGRNISDPYSFSNLHNALILSLMRERDALIANLQSKTEQERKANLELIHKHEAKIAKLNELYTKTEQERIDNLELIHKHEELLKKRDEDLLQLNKELAHWKQEATSWSGIGRLILRRIRNIDKNVV